MSLKLAVALPFSGRFVPPEFGMALASLQFPMNCNYMYLSVKGEERAVARTKLVNTARKFGAEYLLFLDDDTVPPADTPRLLMKELEQNEKAAVCGGIYTSRTSRPFEPMVFVEGKGGPFWRWRFGDVFKASAVGTGCMMIKLSALESIPQPWFWDINDKAEALASDPDIIMAGECPVEPQKFSMTDDIYFCYKVRKHGFEILAHGGVLPVHYNPDGTAAVLSQEDFPLRNINAVSIWYNSILPADYYDPRYQEHNNDGLPNGWLTLEEAARLAKEVKGKRVLEFGSYKGRSTVAMAETADQVFAVDTFEGNGGTGGKDTLGDFLTNTAHLANVVPVICPTYHLTDVFANQAFEVVFVDADHTLAGATADFELAKQFGERILAHDWGLFEVSQAAEAAGLEPLWVEGTLVELVRKST